MHAAWRLRAKLLPASCHQAYHRHMYTYVSSIVLSNFMYTLTTWLGQYILSTAKYLQSHDVRSAKLNYIHKRKNIDIFISWCCHISDRNVLIWYIGILVSEAPSYYECLLDRYDEIDNGCFVVGVFFLEVLWSIPSQTYGHTVVLKHTFAHCEHVWMKDDFPRVGVFIYVLNMQQVQVHIQTNV